jgi:saccharopine dehydrogenase-like NADP-dependent oxidoreductase
MLQVLLVLVAASVSVTWALSSSSNTFVILGGTGRIGTAVATHLLQRQPSAKIILAGRNAERGRRAVQELLEESSGDAQVEWKQLADVWDASALSALVELGDCLIHTAGPYFGRRPVPLEVAVASPRCKVYVDVSDPLDYLEASLQLSETAKDSGTSALLAAGAFPGMSNVLAMEAAHHLNSKVRDLFFNYFTSGLGGSGDVNLYITNLGFGEPMAQYEKGKLRLFQALSGRLLGKVSFYLENGEAKQRIGQQTVFSWPFPEAATVPRELKIVGDSSAAMGTAPDFWNVMLGVLVSLVPRPWWRSEVFSKFLANFSQPLVKATDSLIGGETHGMRIDVTGTDGRAVSIVQAHDSFRQCVGQSCAEFALDLMSHDHPGVHLPEQLYRNDMARKRILAKLTTTPGTFLYTGPVEVSEAPAPTLMEQALLDANKAEIKI